MVNESNKILSILKSLNDENENLIIGDEDDKDYLTKLFKNWSKKYDEFNDELINSNNKRKGKEEEGKIEKEFKILIKKLESLNESRNDIIINKAIKYLDKANKILNSLKNTEKYVDCIIDEYQNIKSEEGKKKSLIKCDIKSGDYIENYEPYSPFQE